MHEILATARLPNVRRQAQGTGFNNYHDEIEVCNARSISIPVRKDTSTVFTLMKQFQNMLCK